MLIARYFNEKAWDIYCNETAGDMHVADFWDDLPRRVQDIYYGKCLDFQKENLKFDNNFYEFIGRHVRKVLNNNPDLHLDRGDSLSILLNFKTLLI